MSWMEMSIPTLPGTSKRPGRNHPGARNIEREEEKKKKNQTTSQGLPDKQEDKADTPPRKPKNSKDTP